MESFEDIAGSFEALGTNERVDAKIMMTTGATGRRGPESDRLSSVHAFGNSAIVIGPRADPAKIDPAVVDRRSRYIGPVVSSALPARDMTIPGITGKAGARILSKDPGGPATRLVDIPAGWAAGAPGAFHRGCRVVRSRG